MRRILVDIEEAIRNQLSHRKVLAHKYFLDRLRANTSEWLNTHRQYVGAEEVAEFRERMGEVNRRAREIVSDSRRRGGEEALAQIREAIPALERALRQESDVSSVDEEEASDSDDDDMA